ncbi:hypothetical protein [Plantactinospora soyae]|uniref:Uncharacterized protein n=1 Tax=Plantactinospora soyae TaxID=1544732 RepID=A0A927M3J2_9ACTN|nr:hypothetical protein [Plantactinospora soyae]MBE1487344.1 hypothetical protein [Plantactinospora soyae]
MKPIPERKPARQLALKLRELKGDIPYARLAKAVHVKPNTLSTMADGTFRGWPSVEQFLLAVQRCGGTISDDDRSECLAYHKIAERLHRERSTATPAPSVENPSSPLPPMTETVVLASPPERSRGSEPEVVLATTDPVDGDDLRWIRDRTAATADDPAASPTRLSLWGRIRTRLGVSRRLVWRTPPRSKRRT